jgi:predicted ATP-grasp superfamily ATP-dependent carboligase
MNVVYLSPHFPPHYHRFCHQLKQAGAKVLGIGDEPYDHLAPEVCASLTEYYRVDDMHNYDGLLRACGFFTHKYGKIDRFESLNEYWLYTEARIRDDFNIFGVRGREIDTIRRKSLMKDKFRAAEVQVPRGRLVQTMEDARNLIYETGYPVVAKPDAGVGALDTYRLNGDEDLENFFARKPAVDYLMEEFIPGIIYSFDGLTDRKGNLVFYTAHTFSQGIMETVNEARHIYYYSLREIPSALVTLGRRCIEAFGVRERFFHIEFFQTAADEYIGLEVNMRPPGGYTTDMFNYACDIDIYRVWAELLVNRSTEIAYARKYHCCYTSRKNNQHYLYRHDDIMARYGDFMVQVASVPGVFSGALGDIGYIFRSAELDHIHEITNFIHAPGNRQD